MTSGGIDDGMREMSVMLLSLSTRIGPRAAYWAIVLLGISPASDFGDVIDSAYKRGDARTVAVLLHSAPAIDLKRRSDLIRWIEEELDVRNETRERMLTATNEGFSEAHDESMVRAPEKAGNKKLSRVVPTVAAPVRGGDGEIVV